MASGHGTGSLNFGAFPGSSEASVSVTGLTGISPTSKVEAYFMADDTSVDHTAADHRYAAALVGLTCGAPSGTAVTVYGRCMDAMQGTYSFRLVWAD